MNKSKGFTLVEVLVTIFIVGILFSIAGVAVFNLIKSSKDTTSVIAEDNVKRMANVYIKEMPDEVSWDKVEGESLDQYTCVSIGILVEKGYINSVNKDSLNMNGLVKFVRDTDGNIISEEVFDVNNIEEIKEMCPNVKIMKPIPKSKDICRTDYSNIEFDGGSLLNDEKLDDYYLPVPFESDGTPGDYSIKLVLNRDEVNYVWSDGTYEDKEIICTIDKKEPIVSLDYENTPDNVEGSYDIKITSSVLGTYVIKNSNPKYVSVTDLSLGVLDENGEASIRINPLANRDVSTYITITVIPSESDLYYSASVIHNVAVDLSMVDLTELKPITIPKNVCKSGLTYTGSDLTLIAGKTSDIKTPLGMCSLKDTNSKKSYGCSLMKAKYAGEYEVRLVLNNASLVKYKWSDGTIGDKVYNCSIATKKVTVPTSVCKSGLTYNGKSQRLITDAINTACVGTKESSRKYNCSLVKATNAGKYEVKLELNNNAGMAYEWSDGTKEHKSYTCSIAKRPTYVELKKNKDTVTDLGSVMKSFAAIEYPVNVKRIRGYYKSGNDIKNLPGKISIEPVVDEETGLTYVGVSSLTTHADYKEATNSYYKATLKGTNIGKNKEFVVKFTPADTVNYKTASKKYTLTITKSTARLIYDTATNGGNACPQENKVIYYNLAYGELCKPTKKGYTFMGWYTSATNRDTKITKDTVYNDKNLKNVTVYAHFKSNDTLTLTFHQYNGTKQESFEKEIRKYNNDKNFSLTMPTPTKYKNSDECGGSWSARGWSKGTEAEATIDYKIGEKYSFTKDMTLYAAYKSDKISLIIDYNGGEYIKSRHHTAYRNASGESYGTSNSGWKDTVSQDAKRSGCTFIGWYEGKKKVISPGGSESFTTCNSDRMISAQWVGC